MLCIHNFSARQSWQMRSSAIKAIRTAIISAIFVVAMGPAGAGAADVLPSRSQIVDAMVLANNHFVAEWPTAGCNTCLPGSRPSNIWTRATHFEGAVALYRI